MKMLEEKAEELALDAESSSTVEIRPILRTTRRSSVCLKEVWGSLYRRPMHQTKFVRKYFLSFESIST